MRIIFYHGHDDASTECRCAHDIHAFTHGSHDGTGRRTTGGEALVVSQFTLAADTSRGTRPGFSYAAKPDMAKALYEHFATHLAALGIPTQTGQFGADMSVALTNDGPVTIWLDTDR